MAVRYFLGTNSPKGFYSYFDGLLNLDQIGRLWILKGGPGCGKSTLMKYVGQRMEEAGQPVEWVPCASDPQSFDAVVFPQMKAAIVDGTSPHVMEPRYPGVVEEYVNLGAFYDRAALIGKRAELVTKADEYRQHFDRVNGCLQAARMLQDDMRRTVVDAQAREKMARRVRGVIAREIRTGTALSVRRCFLSAITPQGIVVCWDTINSLCSRVIEISDKYGQSHELLAPILKAATDARQKVYIGYHPMGPAGKLEHILLPELDLAFVTSSDAAPYEGETYRRIRLDACLDPEVIRAKRTWLRFLRKTITSLTEDAVASLRQANSCHDQIEALYNPHVDFDGVQDRARNIAETLLAEV